MKSLVAAAMPLILAAGMCGGGEEAKAPDPAQPEEVREPKVVTNPDEAQVGDTVVTGSEAPQ